MHSQSENVSQHWFYWSCFFYNVDIRQKRGQNSNIYVSSSTETQVTLRLHFTESWISLHRKQKCCIIFFIIIWHRFLIYQFKRITTTLCRVVEYAVYLHNRTHWAYIIDPFCYWIETWIAEHTSGHIPSYNTSDPDLINCHNTVQQVLIVTDWEVNIHR